MECFPHKRKVIAYVVQRRNDQWLLAIFSHRDFPEAGVQVPGGTVNEGESLEMAVAREVQEESGLKHFTSIFLLGKDRFLHQGRSEIHDRHFFALIFEGNSPDKFSHQVSAGMEDCGLVFMYSWCNLDKVPALAGEQDAYLSTLKARLNTLE